MVVVGSAERSSSRIPSNFITSRLDLNRIVTNGTMSFVRDNPGRGWHDVARLLLLQASTKTLTNRHEVGQWLGAEHTS